MKNKWRIIFLWVCLLSSIPLSAEITEHQVNDITYIYDSGKNMIYNKSNTFPKGKGASDYCLQINPKGRDILYQKLRNIFSKERIKEFPLTRIRVKIYVPLSGKGSEIVFFVAPEMKEKLTHEEFYAMEKELKQFKDYITFTSGCRKGVFYIMEFAILFDSLYKRDSIFIKEN